MKKSWNKSQSVHDKLMITLVYVNYSWSISDILPTTMEGFGLDKPFVHLEKLSTCCYVFVHLYFNNVPMLHYHTCGINWGDDGKN